MALLMGQLAAPRPAGEPLLARGIETLIGACFGMAIVLVEQGFSAPAHAQRGAAERSRQGV